MDLPGFLEIRMLMLWIPKFGYMILLPATRGGEALASAVAFSFPLCGASDTDWTIDSAMRFLRAQVLEFSHHLSDIEVTDVLPLLGACQVPGFGSFAGVRGTTHAHVYVCGDAYSPMLYVYS